MKKINIFQIFNINVWLFKLYNWKKDLLNILLFINSLFYIKQTQKNSKNEINNKEVKIYIPEIPKISNNELTKVQKTKKNNLNEQNENIQEVVEIKKNYELKNFYFDRNNNIINDNEQTNEWLLNKGTIKLYWDNKTGIFGFDFVFINRNSISNLVLNFNNGETIKEYTPNYINDNNNFKFSILSNQIFGSSTKINDIKTIQITLNSNYGKKIISIVLDDYDAYDKDFLIYRNKKIVLKFQKEILINGDQIIDKFSSIDLEPYVLEQGKWNKKIFKINEQSNDLFERNKFSLISLEGLPISETSKSSFDSYIEKQETLNNICISQNTYYDLDKKETVKGFGLNSNSGYIIPFEFFGYFFPILTLNINNINFRISWEIIIDKPYFKNNTGIIKVNIENSFNENSDNDWISVSQELLDEAEMYNLTFDELLIFLRERENLAK